MFNLVQQCFKMQWCDGYDLKMIHRVNAMSIPLKKRAWQGCSSWAQARNDKTVVVQYPRSTIEATEN